MVVELQANRHISPHGLLSVSAMNTFYACPRKYAYKYIDRVPVEDVAKPAMDRGRAFHLLAECDGKVSEGELLEEVGRDLFELAKVKSAYAKYKSYIDKRLLPKLERNEEKLISEEHQFIGYCDYLGVDESSGRWMLGELKTTTRLDPLKWNLLEMNTQIALYSSFLKQFAHNQYLDFDDYLGVSYRTVTITSKKPLEANSRRKVGESAAEFRERIKDDTDVYHKIVRPTDDAKASALQSFEKAKQDIASLGTDSRKACKNTQSCFMWNPPCEYFTHCHGLDPNNDTISAFVDYNS